MRYTVRLNWSSREGKQKHDTVASTVVTVEAASEDEARALATAWHKEQGYGGKLEIEAVGLCP